MPAKTIFTDEQTAMILNHYSINNNIIMASRDFNLSQRTITTLLKRCNVYKPTKFYQYNHDYFNDINNHKKAYILGMLLTDGCNYVKNTRIMLKLKSDDFEIVEKINKELCIDRPIKFSSIQFDKFIGNYVEMTVHSPIISKRLEALGIPERKTFKIKPEFWMMGEFSNSAILGMMDGDGSLYKRERLYRNRITPEKSWTFSFIGMKSICEMMQRIFKENLNINSCVSPHSRYKNNIEKPLCTVRVYGNLQVKILMDWLYKDSSLYMKRKHDNYLELIEFLKTKRKNQFC